MKMPLPHPRRTRKAMIYTAVYRDHPIARYNSNALIRALPVLDDHETLARKLTRLPNHDEDQRYAPRAQRVLRLAELARFNLGLPRVVELRETLHALICEGYMGREPYSEADIALRQKHYEMQQRGESFDTDEFCEDFEDTLADQDNVADFVAALIGIPGIGKSKALKYASAPYRRVIYHPELDIHQIPALLIEMPYKGINVNALANAVIRALDKAYAAGDYYNTYLKGRSNAEILFMDAVELLQTHYVGILLIDESQNRDYRSRTPSKPTTGQTPLTTLLITATNSSQIPMMMTGTPELRDILAVRMSMLRRMVGRGMSVWEPLSLSTYDADGNVVMGEFDTFLELLWPNQWTKTPFELTPRMRNLFYYYTQGISDIIIKLFHDIQLRAIRKGGEEIVDEALLHDVANKEMKALTELTEAMRTMDYDRTARSADLAAYLKLDPHELTFERDQVNAELFGDEIDPDVAPEDEVEEVPSIVPEEAASEPHAFELPAGKPKRKRSPSKKASVNGASASVAPMPEVDPLDDIDDAFEG